MLAYLVGDKRCFVAAVTASGARVSELSLDADAAAALGVEPGPLTASGLRTALAGAGGAGVAAAARRPPRPRRLAPAGGSLEGPDTQAATRAADRRHGQAPLRPARRPAGAPCRSRRWWSTPSGGPRYLLDAGPPVSYGAVGRRPAEPGRAERLAGPRGPRAGAHRGRPGLPRRGRPRRGGARVAGAADAAVAVRPGRRQAAPGSRSRGRRRSGSPSRSATPASGPGCSPAPTPPRRAVRYWAPGRRVLHLACHGLVDEDERQLLRGAGAGPRSAARLGAVGRRVPDAPGGLRAGSEVMRAGRALGLPDELGPQQKGEGTLALSRGFLVAGARRVVASNWLVDDEAAAGLMRVFCRQPGPGREGRVERGLRGRAEGGEAVGPRPGDLAAPVLLGHAGPRRAALIRAAGAQVPGPPRRAARRGPFFEGACQSTVRRPCQKARASVANPIPAPPWSQEARRPARGGGAPNGGPRQGVALTLEMTHDSNLLRLPIRGGHGIPSTRGRRRHEPSHAARPRSPPCWG